MPAGRNDPIRLLSGKKTFDGQWRAEFSGFQVRGGALKIQIHQLARELLRQLVWVILDATHERALSKVALADLQYHALRTPDYPSQEYPKA